MVQIKELSCASWGLKNIVVIVIIIQTGVENKSYWSLQVIFFAVWGQKGRVIGREPASQHQIFPYYLKQTELCPLKLAYMGTLSGVSFIPIPSVKQIHFSSVASNFSLGDSTLVFGLVCWVWGRSLI